MTEYSDILTFWFGSGKTNLDVMNEKSGLWWKKDDELDREIKINFETRLNRLPDGDLDDWLEQPQGRLAMIILADQFSRNIYRNTADAFAFDVQARLLVHDGINNEVDKQLRLIEQVFFNMPLMHSESLEDQDLSISQFEKIVNRAQDEERERIQGNLNYAVAHRDIIVRFGRYPHRNEILGRESTPEEMAFLNQPGSSF